MLLQDDCEALQHTVGDLARQPRASGVRPIVVITCTASALAVIRVVPWTNDGGAAG